VHAILLLLFTFILFSFLAKSISWVIISSNSPRHDKLASRSGLEGGAVMDSSIRWPFFAKKRRRKKKKERRTKKMSTRGLYETNPFARHVSSAQ
jgi:hypothetical protein